MDNPKHLVCYIDLLGFKEILNSEIEEAKNRIKDMLPSNTLAGMMASYGVDFFAVSDGILFYRAVPADLQREQALTILRNFLLILQIYQKDLLIKGILMRGGLTFGEFQTITNRVGLVDVKNFLGKAMVKAYKMESEFATYPRIIVDHSVLLEKPFEFNNMQSIEKALNELLMFRPVVPIIGVEVNFESGDYLTIDYLKNISLPDFEDICARMFAVFNKLQPPDVRKKIDWCVSYLMYSVLSKRTSSQSSEKIIEIGDKFGFRLSDT